MRPEVSFIIPVFNKEAYLAQCLESVLGQTLREIEVICIDDASTDGSRALLEAYAARDGRLRLLRQQINLGPGPARNRGLAAATGRFIRMVDADDLVPPGSTAVLHRKASETGADLVRGTLARFADGDHGEIIYTARAAEGGARAFDSDPALWIPWWHTSYLIASDLLCENSIAYPDLGRGEDPVFMAAALAKSQCVATVADVVYLYRAYLKSTGAGGETFADVVDTFRHAARVRSLFLARHPPAWHEGYGPFLRADLTKFIGRCKLNAAERRFAEDEARKLWPEGLGIDDTVAGLTRSTERDHWNAVFRKEDPWNYASDYEQVKYRHTLDLVPAGAIHEALEIGCAEGLFTAMLAPRVAHLMAIDISETALARAKSRCGDLDNVSFLEHDIASGLPGRGFDLIVCSEILYYLRDGAAVEAFASKACNALRPGGHLVMAHANMAADDRTVTGFDFNEIGAAFVGETFAAQAELEFLCELRTDLYRVQLFRRREEAASAHTGARPHEVVQRRHGKIRHPAIKWGGCAVTAAEARHLWTSRDVPVLMYHRIATDGPAGLAPYRVAPGRFEQQLAWLRREGWESVDLADYCRKRFAAGYDGLPGKRFVLTFDDAYGDFPDVAWPMIRAHGFAATVFVPVDFVGGHADWDADQGLPAPLMDWAQIIALHRQGVAFGSHSCCHRRLWEMKRPEVLADALRSRLVLEARLGAPVTGYCYPYAAADESSRAMIRDAGFSFAVAGRAGDPPNRDDPFYMPRIEILGSDDLDRFIAKLPHPDPASDEQRQHYADLRARRDRATYMDQ